HCQVLTRLETTEAPKLSPESLLFYELFVLGAGVNLSLAPGLAVQGILVAFASANPLSFYGFVFAYFTAGVVFCTGASLSLDPKRIVSPITLQYVTAPLLA